MCGCVSAWISLGIVQPCLSSYCMRRVVGLSLSWTQPPVGFQVCSGCSKAQHSAERECQWREDERKLQSQRRWDPLIQVLTGEKRWVRRRERIVGCQLTSNSTADQSLLNVRWGTMEMCLCMHASILLHPMYTHVHLQRVMVRRMCACMCARVSGKAVCKPAERSEALNLVHLLKLRLPRRTSVALWFH